MWERRYGVLSPARTAGGQRLYSEEDERRIRTMLDHLDSGLSPAEAARLVATAGSPPTNGALAGRLAESLNELDDAGAHAALDGLFAELGVERALSDVVIPYLREVGDRWACGEMTVAEEHFASRLLHARLLGAARGWDAGEGPRAVLACPPGEEHDLPLIAFGIALRRRGWRVTYLGANTPLGPLERLVDDVGADAVVLAATTPTRFAAIAEQLGALSARLPVYIAGAGANAKLAADTRTELIDRDPVAGAAEVALKRRN